MMMTFFGDVVDTPKEAIENEKHQKREELKGVISMGKTNLLGHKWTPGRVDKASDQIINKTYAEYKQRELNEKGEKAAKALGKYAINLYSRRISWLVKIRDVKKLRQDIEEVIKHQMANLGCLLVYTFGDYLAPILVAVQTVEILDRGDEPENEGYKSEA